jgi:segregation and condensation protein A
VSTPTGPAAGRRRRRGEEVPPAGTLPAAWRVQLPIFEGPLDLLLQLVRVNQVDLRDIPVVTICDQFHEYLALMEELDLDIAGEFIYEAAQLIVLKSKLLLPRPTREDGSPVEGEDPRQELVERLLEYRRLKEAAQVLAEVDRLRQGIWTRRGDPKKELGLEVPEQIEITDVSLSDLMTAFRRVLVRFEKEHPEPIHLQRESFPVRGELEGFLALLAAGQPFDLVANLRARSCRAEVIAAFLAVLELARLQLIRVQQGSGEEIFLHRTTRELAREELEAIRG